MKQNGLVSIKQRLSSMSPVEKKIALYILEDPVRAVNSTIGNLAADAGVAVSSVVNFAVSLGFRGFSEMKINMAQNLTGLVEAAPELPEREGDAKAKMRRLITAVDASFEDTFQAMGEELDQAANLIVSASQIEIFGAGASAPMAEEAHFRLKSIGLVADFTRDAICGCLNAGKIPPDGCALVISHSGRTNSVLVSAEQAKARGANVVAITSFAISPLTRIADVSLLAISGEAKAYHEALAARMSKLLLLDCLCAAIEERLGPEMARNREEELNATKAWGLRR